MAKLKNYLDDYVSLVMKKTEMKNALDVLEDESHMPLTVALLKEELKKINQKIYAIENTDVEEK